MSSIVEKIYFDYAATTPIDPEVKKAMELYLEDKFGNPSSTHSLGQEARVAVDKARETVADFLGCNFIEVYFTSGATEANNLAIKGVINKFQVSSFSEAVPPLAGRYGAGKFQGQIITNEIEHKSVLKPVESLEKSGLVEAIYLPVDKNGAVDINNLKNKIKENTALISAMYVNNETGVIQPIGEIGKIIKEWKTENRSKLGIQYPLFHIDAVQAAGYLPLNIRDLGCDLLSLSAHKIGGPKGIGVLFVKDGTPIAPLIEGGGQEFGLRSGTENVVGIVGLGKAVEIIRHPSFNFQFPIFNKITNPKSQIQNITSLRDYFEENLLKNIKNTSVNGGGAPRAPHISNILFKGAEAETLLIALDEAGIMASSGSACQAKAIEPSYVLLATGLSKKETMSSVRFSFGKFTTQEEIDRVLKILPEMIEKLRK